MRYQDINIYFYNVKIIFISVMHDSLLIFLVCTMSRSRSELGSARFINIPSMKLRLVTQILSLGNQ